MPPNRLILIAHAATAATQRSAFPSNVEALAPAGLAAARMLSGRFTSATASFVSPAQAATLTAAALGLEAAVCTALNDINVGKWVGRSIVDIAPAEAAKWYADPCYVHHGGESLVALVERVANFLAQRLTTKGTTVAITHVAPIRAALLSALGAPTSAFWHIDVSPLEALVLGSNGRRWSLRGLGPLEHTLEA